MDSPPSSILSHPSRPQQRNSFLSQGLSNLRISQCNKSVEEARSNLESKISSSTSSSKVSSYFLSYAYSTSYHKNYACHSMYARHRRVQFRDLQKNGLPVVLVSVRNESYVMLLEKPIDNISFCKGFNEIIEDNLEDSAIIGVQRNSLLHLVSIFPMLKKLLSSAVALQ